MNRLITKYLSAIGRKGGATTGPSKSRGGPEYYRKLRLAQLAKKKGKK